MAALRIEMVVSEVLREFNEQDIVIAERLRFRIGSATQRESIPRAELTACLVTPALFGKATKGRAFYIDISPVV